MRISDARGTKATRQTPPSVIGASHGRALTTDIHAYAYTNTHTHTFNDGRVVRRRSGNTHTHMYTHAHAHCWSRIERLCLERHIEGLCARACVTLCVLVCKCACVFVTLCLCVCACVCGWVVGGVDFDCVCVSYIAVPWESHLRDWCALTSRRPYFLSECV